MNDGVHNNQLKDYKELKLENNNEDTLVNNCKYLHINFRKSPKFNILWCIILYDNNVLKLVRNSTHKYWFWEILTLDKSTNV